MSLLRMESCMFHGPAVHGDTCVARFDQYIIRNPSSAWMHATVQSKHCNIAYASHNIAGPIDHVQTATR